MAFELKIANLGKDSQIVETARNAALKVLEGGFSFVESEKTMLNEIKIRYSLKKDVDFSMIS